MLVLTRRTRKSGCFYPQTKKMKYSTGLESNPGPTLSKTRANKCRGRDGVVLRVPFPAGAVGEFSSPELTFCADSYSVSVPPPRYRRTQKKPPVKLQNAQVADYR